MILIKDERRNIRIRHYINSVTMKDEFTTKMHADMLGWSQEDTRLIEIWTDIRAGEKKSDVCKKYGISEEYYDENIEAALERCD